MNIAVMGSGYVGLVAGVCFADAGHRLTCVDSDESKIDRLNRGELPFYEPGLSDLFERNQKRMTFTGDIGRAVRQSDVIFVAVGTPELPDGSADLGPTFNVLGEICRAADAPKIVVFKSTVPIGTARKAEAFCREHAKHALEIVSNPEFLRQGSALKDFLNPDRVVIGCKTEHAREVMGELYRPFLGDTKPLICMDNTSAEMTKYAANSFLAAKISFINELALLADKVGANINDVRAGFTSDARINPAFFYPGIGYGGSCFPKDVRALIHTGDQHGVDFLLLKAADAVNERQKTIIAERLKQRFGGDLRGKSIALWGLSFKPETDDVRRAPSLSLIEDLVQKGAVVKAFDPVAVENAKSACKAKFVVAEDPLDAATGADALVLVTEWNVFKSVDLVELRARLKHPIVFDGRNVFDPEKMQELGFEYSCIGTNVAAANDSSVKLNPTNSNVRSEPGQSL